MLALAYLLSLQESFFDGSDWDSIVEVILQHHLASPWVWVSNCWILLVFVTLHCESLSTSRLAVCKDGGMKTVNYFLNQASNLKFFKNITLSTRFVQNLVKLVSFACAAVGLEDWNLVVLRWHFEQRNLVFLLNFVLKKRPDPDSDSDVWRHLNK